MRFMTGLFTCCLPPVALWEFFWAPVAHCSVTVAFLQVACWLLGFHQLTQKNCQHILHVSWCKLKLQGLSVLLKVGPLAGAISFKDSSGAVGSESCCWEVAAVRALMIV